MKIILEALKTRYLCFYSNTGNMFWKHDIFANVTWDSLDQSDIYITLINCFKVK
jgi:hypothetical protein